MDRQTDCVDRHTGRQWKDGQADRQTHTRTDTCAHRGADARLTTHTHTATHTHTNTGQHHEGMVVQVYGVIGNPVGHSRSPQLHNAAMEAAGLDSVYLPFLVDDLRLFLTTYSSPEYGGFSVTIPHKVCSNPCMSLLLCFAAVVLLGRPH